MRFLNTLGLTVLTLAAMLPGFASAQDCDRACLQAVTDNYLQAVVAQDPQAAPVIVGYRQTENAEVKRLGTGVWQSVTGLHTGARYYLDPLEGQALWFGVVDEGDIPALVMVRLRIVGQQVVEAEWYLSRPGADSMQGPVNADGSGANLYAPDNLEANPPPVRNIAKAERLSRLSLIGVANSYFDGITENDGSLILSHPDCIRLENGFAVTSRPLAAGRTDGYQGRANCSSGMDTFNIALVSGRRFFIVDEEQQVAVSSAVFLRNANGFQRRCVFIELFYIDENLISQIYSVIYYPDPGTPVPNWAPYSGNFPLPESFGAAR